MVKGSPFPAGSVPTLATVDPTGTFLYVSNNGSGNVSAYMIDQSTGALTEVSGSPFAAGTGPCGVAVAAVASQ